MDVENHKYVYLADNVTVDASKEAGQSYLKEIRVRMAGNKYVAHVLRQGGSQDPRIKRVARLLEQLNGQEQAMCDFCVEVFDTCARNPVRYVGFDPHLDNLMKKLRRAADYADEFGKRILLWVEHLRITGSVLSDTASRSLESSLPIQRDMTLGIVWSAAMACPAKIRPPGPGSLPYHPQGAPNPEEKAFRPYVDGKPVPLLEQNYYSGDLRPVNWRFDPDVRAPSPYCKFFRFNGPYFRPNKPLHPRNLNTFFMPESAVNIWHYYMRRYNQVENNFKATGRLPTRNEEEEAEHQVQQKLYGVHLAASSGENYDIFSIVNKVDHYETIEKSTEAYVFVKPGTQERQVNFGDGTGRFKPEDLNRAMKICETGERHSVPTVDHGKWLEMDRKIEHLEAP
ncbi:mating type [Diaporthe amygdali]|uniref:mating type n=1 Tax=Phomopsis amygdali TaxID=1214568 RepID=UPI0022FE58B6|nr:mating type [Diaporthe amygdali]KAJ0123428.1 mating type [Diaporthe amygdali]